jgi:hypothetical protein
VQERVILAVMAIWGNGRHELVHYEIAESEANWKTVFKNLKARGFELKSPGQLWTLINPHSLPTIGRFNPDVDAMGLL